MGAGFLFAPDAALALADHELEALPQVMGGRYLSYGLILAVVALRRDWLLLACVLAIFGVVGGIDAAIYWQSNMMPHLVAGALGFAAAGAALMLGRSDG